MNRKPGRKFRLSTPSSHQIKFLTTEDEYELIKSKAEQVGLSLSEYLRSKALAS